MFGIPAILPNNFLSEANKSYAIYCPMPDPALNVCFDIKEFTHDKAEEITLKDLDSENLSKTVDDLLKKYGQKFPHLESARLVGFRYTRYDKSEVRFSEGLKSIMQHARAATNPSAREILFNVDNLSSFASSSGRTLEQQLVLTLSNEACHVLWGKSITTRSEDQANKEIDEVWKRHLAKDQTLTTLEQDIIDRTRDEFVSSVVMRITEICLSSSKRINFEEFIQSEKSFLNYTLSAHVSSGFAAVFPSKIIERFKQANISTDNNQEDQKYKILIDRINNEASSSKFGQLFIEDLKKSKLPIDFHGIF